MVIAVLIGLGLIFGSFVNAFVWRHHKRAELSLELEELETAGKSNKDAIGRLKAKRAKLSVSRGRSMCTHCRHELGPFDLIPIISYIWLRGKCRYCGKKIDDTPLAEILTPALFVVSYVFWPLGYHGTGLFILVCWLFFMVGFVALTLYDLRWFLLPHSIVLPLIAVAIVQVIVVAGYFRGGVKALGVAAIGAVIIGGLFYLLYKLSREQWIGGGDITLGVLLGLLVGGPTKAFMVIFLASLFGTLIALPLLATGKADRSTHLPFGPFLMLGAVVTMLFGSRLLDWYTTHFLAAFAAALLH